MVACGDDPGDISMDEHRHDHPSGGDGATEATTVTDPVCGMKVNPATSRHRFEHGGKIFHFCCAGCRTKFEADPVKYLAPRVSAPVKADGIYTCPMHPEIRQQGPGSCPICGMALEPEMPAADSGPNVELIDMTRRFWIGLVLGLPVIALEMGGHFVDMHQWIDPALSNTIQSVSY